jgi:phospholipase/lecithinase/hemolysin
MKKFEIDVDINGTITFEVEAKNKKEAQAKVDDILSNTSVKEAIKSYRNNIVLNDPKPLFMRIDLNKEK